MNSAPSIDCSLAASSNRLFFIVACLALAASVPAAVPDGANAGSKTYTLFMGADLDVQLNKVDHRVRDVSGGSFLINVDGKELLVPMYEGTVNLRVAHSLKLTEASATIARLKSERAYTSANDPTKKFMREQPGSNAQATVARADGAYLVISNLAAAGGSASGGGASGPGGMPVASAEVQAARSAADSAGTAMFAEGNNIGNYVSKMQGELAQELFDAMEVSFEVSAEEPLKNPYVVIVARFHERDAKSGQSKNWIFAKALNPIDHTPRKVQLKQGGFPPGFEMEDVKVHLYDRGQELATNVADKRVELTRDEAFQYVVMDYVSSHKGASAPATLAMGRLPADWRTRLGAGQLTQFFYVKVSKDGLPLEAYVDQSCSQKVDDPYLQSVIREIRFKPALEKGRPIEGVALLRFGDLRI